MTEQRGVLGGEPDFQKIKILLYLMDQDNPNKNVTPRPTKGPLAFMIPDKFSNITFTF